MINNSKFKNRLGEETSPYLLQHAHNPVDWYPWGEEALNKAKIENKPILVSIGYSACHWCHVMEHESFEDEEIAKIMNSFFINIKVDREERPDVDSVYMDALHAMGLRGGWPLNVFLMPNAKPFYGGTYFPKKNWANLLYSIHNAFETESEKLYKSAEGFAESLNQKDTEKYNLKFEDSPEVMGFTNDELDQMVFRISQDFDLIHGGLQRSPKFPMPSIWLFLVRYLSVYSNDSLLKHLKFTLDRIALGGIYDHLGGAWTRYSTDEYWKIPHFEKMLYDNGQLLSLYSEAIALFKNKNIFEDSQKLYLESVNKTVDWLKNEMYSPDHGFYSAQDADSEGVEGKYYVWSEQEIDQILVDNNNDFKSLFEINEHGNWEHGNNVLHLEIIPNDSVWEKLKENFKSLKIQRDQRIKPGLDNKIICSWNGLALNGLVSVYKVTQNIEYLDLALKNAHFIKDSLTVDVFTEDQKKGRGLHHIYKSKKQIFGFLDDYAAVIQSYIELYQVCFQEIWLQEAYNLAKYCIANFYDEKEGLFFFTDIQSEELIARKKEIFDNVIPSSNSMMASNLHKLGHFFDDAHFIEISNLMFGLFKKLCIQDIQWVSNWASFGLCLSGPLTEIAILSKNPTLCKANFDTNTYLPFALYASSENPTELPLLLNRGMIENSDTFYVCLDKTCHLPTTSFEKALEILRSTNA